MYSYRSAPNPVSDELLVTAADPDQPTDAPARLSSLTADSAALETTLYDNYGRPVKTQHSAHGQAMLNVRDLPNGLYHLRTGHGKGLVTEHIQVIH
ncbi:T9SS type A sorting domain-containing protein [Hymenobacter psoromatis]|uniref:T9SS type A sorting domain-containing protein n=1 Tax=Hymenobacter psoromatis TaxID=1484116 RepID=UPI001CBC3607|nr:T9SS type A sorting domain-containing protein [Hymenobacter psoromatis]